MLCTLHTHLCSTYRITPTLHYCTTTVPFLFYCVPTTTHGFYTYLHRSYRYTVLPLPFCCTPLTYLYYLHYYSCTATTMPFTTCYHYLSPLLLSASPILTVQSPPTAFCKSGFFVCAEFAAALPTYNSLFLDTCLLRFPCLPPPPLPHYHFVPTPACLPATVIGITHIYWTTPPLVAVPQDRDLRPFLLHSLHTFLFYSFCWTLPHTHTHQFTFPTCIPGSHHHHFPCLPTILPPTTFTHPTYCTFSILHFLYTLIPPFYFTFSAYTPSHHLPVI